MASGFEVSCISWPFGVDGRDGAESDKLTVDPLSAWCIQVGIVGETGEGVELW
jgi:hypothetical protein